MKTRCPACRKPVPAGAKFHPFCSERCKYIDLGEWLTGSYRVTERDDPDSLPLEMQDKKIRH